MTTSGIEERFAQASEDCRAFMDLRFKHFTTFVVIETLVAGGAVHEQALRSGRLLLVILGLVVTVLFWLLDGRTMKWHEAARLRVAQYEAALGPGAVALTSPSSRWMPRASLLTNLLFAVFASAWVVALTMVATSAGVTHKDRGSSTGQHLVTPACSAPVARYGS